MALQTLPPAPSLPDPSPPAPSPAGTDSGLDTAPLRIAAPTTHDCIACLDHRSRRHAVSRDHALPGHYLSLENGAGDVVLIPIPDRVTHMGRAASAGLRFEDPHVSRRHAILVRYGRRVRVLDDRSSEGTFVNGTRVVATNLSNGDVVRLGPVSFTYTIVR